MLIEFHLIQNHSPANLNRDDLGAPKSCLFGGVMRARVSSQCLKRSIRTSPEFLPALEKDGGVRTRRMVTLLADEAFAGAPTAEQLDWLAKAFVAGGVSIDAVAEDANATNILLFVPRSTISAMAADVREGFKAKTSARALAETLAKRLAVKPAVPDVALCGRMTELDKDGLFKGINFHVEAALSAAHAFSTHEVVNEVDYFTAVDDKAKGTGAGHVNEGMFASACFYKHYSIDWEQLVSNLNGDVALARLTVEKFLRAAALTMPSGKQKSFAAFNPPDGILGEIKLEAAMPISYANAFAEPVALNAPRGIVGESIARLGQYAYDIGNGYGIRSSRFWFSPEGRFPLMRTPRNEKSAREVAVVEKECEFGAFAEFVKKITATLADHASASGRK
ncbi:MAG: type I-E CRISPR-associated protein Cas7/Cse4/CasC [Planctomycetia bacterium]|nr:type I-E CRISPR-associated protein Cas7/Cse4/CasC [Planctomycetia bacterium]